MAKAQDITKEEFLAAYNKYPPNKWIKFIYRYFSQETEAKDMKVGLSITIGLIIFFCVGLIGTMFNFPDVIIKVASLIYGGVLIVLVASLFSAVKMNDFRLKKVQKELGIGSEWYNNLASNFLYSE